MPNAVLRHSVAITLTAGALLASPYVAGWAFDVLAFLLQGPGRTDFVSADVMILDGASSEPLGGMPTLLFLLTCITVVCVLGERLRQKWKSLTWWLPFVAAFLLGGVAAVGARGGGTPEDIAAILGAVVAWLVFVWTGTYWWTLAVMSRSRWAAGA
jgi:hypothetical protein